MFDIYLSNERVSESESPIKAIYGKLQINDESETFIASLAIWSEDDYRRHWQSVLERVLRTRRDAALITSYVTPDLEEFLIWWPLYVENDIVYVRNELLFFSQLQTPFSIENPWKSLRPRRTQTSEGLLISEWVTTISSLQECLNKIISGTTNIVK